LPVLLLVLALALMLAVAPKPPQTLWRQRLRHGARALASSCCASSIKKWQNLWLIDVPSRADVQERILFFYEYVT
jgi:hypothetical protein